MSVAFLAQKSTNLTKMEKRLKIRIAQGGKCCHKGVNKVKVTQGTYQP